MRINQSTIVHTAFFCQYRRCRACNGYFTYQEELVMGMWLPSEEDRKWDEKVSDNPCTCDR